MLHRVDDLWHRLSRRLRHPRYYLRFWLVTTAVTFLAVTVASVGWVALRALAVRSVAADLVADADRLEAQVKAGDVSAATATLRTLREHSERANALTHDPAWALVSRLPVAGDDVRAVRALTGSAARITEAARPLETSLPALAGSKGGIDLTALGRVSAAMPKLSEAVDASLGDLQGITPEGIVPQLGDAVTKTRTTLLAVRDPLRGADKNLDVLTTLLGGSGPRTYVVLLQQDAEARGTGGLVGSYAVMKADAGKISLDSVNSRLALQNGVPIPLATVPEDLQDLWGPDLQEWAGLNLSPHFPWTGRLVAAGWAATPGRPAIDGVIALDQNVVAAMLSATGPLTVRGATVTPQNAVQFLSTGIYAQFPDYRVVDVVAGELVAQAFGKLTSGAVSPVALAQALRTPIAERRLLVWSRHEEEQAAIEASGFGGVLPGRPGPFAMAVINNGGGNKLDAYLRTAVEYDPGQCADGVRIGSITVGLRSIAPKRGLPAYVVAEKDLTLPADRTTTRPTRVLVDVYGPVGSSAPSILVDDRDVEPLVQGTDRGHSVWRIPVDLAPGQLRTVELTVVQPTTKADAPTATVLTQPMVNRVGVTVGKLTPCG